MKWMGWGPADLAEAPPEMVDEIVRLINRENEEWERARNK